MTTIEGEIVESTGRELVTQDATVMLPTTVDEAVEQFDQYQELTRRLLNDSDYQVNGKERFKKKSAWRKYAKAFNLMDRVVYEHVERARDGWPLWARIRVEARAANGRTSEAGHECHISERCCPAAWSEYCRKADWEKHACCSTGCSGRSHWSHPGDITETALTRAKNRAISDLIGAGEVSAEEIGRDRGNDAPPAQRANPAASARTQQRPAPQTGQQRQAAPGGTAPSTEAQGKLIHTVLTKIKALDTGLHDAILAGAAINTPKFIGEDGKPHTSALTIGEASALIDVLNKAHAEAQQAVTVDPDDLPFE